VKATGTPRRLVVTVSDVDEAQPALNERRKGPSAKAAYGEDGAPTKAAEGFARSCGVSVESLETESTDQGDYVFATRDEPGRSAAEVLPEAMAGLVEGLAFPKEMLWGDGKMRFVRPVRWIVALLGPDVVGFEVDGLRSDRTTHGHRFLAPGPFDVPDADGYAELIAGRGKVVLSRDVRASAIRDGLAAVAEERGWRAVLDDPPFSEVVNLVEAPHVLLGSFGEEYAKLPREVLTTAMESHQRYFPVEDSDGRLAPAFLVVHNGDPAASETIVRGHERVLQARLADAGFFFAEDRKRSLEDRLEDLDGLVFQEKLGTVHAKAHRLAGIAEGLAAMLDADADVSRDARRAALLAKTDLVTDMVVEFPTLQGVMGREYARLDGEGDEVAEAVFEHYLPRFTKDGLPAGLAGSIVSVADKMDTITGCFAVGLLPTGSEDPYALRRQGLGVVRIAAEKGLAFDLVEVAQRALGQYTEALPGLDESEVLGEVTEFLTDRVRSYLMSQGYAYDRVDAVLAGGARDVLAVSERAKAITEFMESPGADDLLTGFTRAANLAQPDLGPDADASLMGDAEKALLRAVETAEQQSGVALDAGDYPAALQTLAALRDPVDRFFLDVLVMDEDDKLRDNRLRLLNKLVAVFAPLGDFSKIVVAGSNEEQ
jgi:glycyl-tRNA synthetase beta chain